MDNKWYFAEITFVNPYFPSCEVRLLYLGAMQDTCMSEMRPVDASSWERVADEDNILAAQAMLIIAGIRSDMAYVSFLRCSSFSISCRITS